MGISKKALCEKHQVSDSRLRRLMKACGLDTGQLEYDETEVKRLEVALQMQSEHRTLEEIAAHFGALTQPQSQQLSQAVASAAREVVNSSKGSREQALGLLDDVAQMHAQQIAPVADRMLLTHLGNELKAGTQSRQFWGAVRQEVMLQMQEGEPEMGTLLDSPTTPALLSSSPSSGSSSTKPSNGNSVGDKSSLPSKSTDCDGPGSNSKNG
ncbi:MAG: hypothetical protein AAF974_00085 [Cyanobacteria bacterium P01_E01_bin.34]